MNDLWRSDISLTPEFAKEIIQAQRWNILKVDQIQYFSEGWDNIAFLVNQKLVFRFPKRLQAEQFLLNENMLLPKLQKKISIKIPNPEFCGNPTEQYPFHFHGYEMLLGTPFYKTDLSSQVLRDCIIQFARFLKDLHSIKAVAAQSMGAVSQIYDKTKVDVVIAMLAERMQFLQQNNVVALDMNFIEQMIHQARTIHLDQGQACLVHGDLDMRHLLIQNQKLSGVIDWGDVGINHPVIDLSSIINMFPTSMHELFFQEYGLVTADVYAYAQFLTLYRAITLMMYSDQIEDKAMFSVAHRSYQRLLHQRHA